MTSKAEPRFDIDLTYGKQGELQIAEFLKWVADGNGRVEVKRKRFLDYNLYVETYCDKGRTGSYQPSGISVTIADAWAFVLGDTGISIVIPTPLLKEAITHRSVQDKQELDGRCPTKGRLVNLSAILDVYRRSIRNQC